VNRIVLAVALLMALSVHAATNERGQLDASPALFGVMAAINAAGYDADLASPNNHPLRDAVRQEIAKRNVPSLPALKQFFAQHRKRNDTLELSQYVSFALSCSGPPSFALNQRDLDIPPDVSPLADLPPLLAAFYREANIEDLWNRSQRAIEQYIGYYQAPVISAVTTVNAYLRQQTSGFKGRHFQIYIELLAAPNQIQTRSYGDEYTIVITPSPEPRIFDIRHGFMHYLLDPLATRYQEILKRKSQLSDHAQRAEGLDDSYKDDFLLLATECLIKSIEDRLDRKPQAADEQLHEGYILVPFFSEHLPIYEKQEQAMLIYYPQLIGSMELLKEDARLTNVQFVKRAPSRVVQAAPPAPPPLTGTAKMVDDAENLYTARQLEPAKELYAKILQEPDEAKSHAQAYYGLARIAALQKDPELAQRLFQKTLELEPEPATRAWTLVYLGRLSGAAGDPVQAAKYFQDALRVEGASTAARQAAEQGAQQTSQGLRP